MFAPLADRLRYRDPGCPVSPRAMELRRQVLKQARTHPGTLFMGAWEVMEGCRTTRCIAGWAQYFGDGEVTTLVLSRAIELLELSYAEFVLQEEGTLLFYAHSALAVSRLEAITEGCDA